MDKECAAKPGLFLISLNEPGHVIASKCIVGSGVLRWESLEDIG